MKIIVFSGPSLSVAEGLQILPEAVFLPPLKQADLISAISKYNPDVVCIIDDYSGQRESVWHSEILYAIEKGVALYGAAAVGALRAFELEHCGMIGVGKVYQMFKQGDLEDDDEVLSLFDCQQSGSYLRRTEPLVNLRETFAQAAHEGIIDNDELALCLVVSKGLFWQDRTFSQLFSRLLDNGISVSLVEVLQTFVTDNYCDIQKLDSMEMLRLVNDKKWVYKQGKIADFDFNKNRSDSLRILYERDRKVWAGEQALSLHDLASYTTLNHPGSEELTFNALNREIASFMAGFLGLNLVDKDIEMESERFRKKHYLDKEEVFAVWLVENDLSAKAFEELMREMALCRQAHKWFLARKKYLRLTKTVLDELHLKNEYPIWKEKMADQEAVVTDRTHLMASLGDTLNLKTAIAEKNYYDTLPWQLSPLQGAHESGLSTAALHLQLLKDKIFRDSFKDDVAAMFWSEE